MHGLEVIDWEGEMNQCWKAKELRKKCMLQEMNQCCKAKEFEGKNVCYNLNQKW
jgi:hypothetical protein